VLKSKSVFEPTVVILLSILAVIPFASSTATIESFWTTGTPMSTTRSEIVGAVLGGKIYIIGGFDENGSSTTVEHMIPSQINGLFQLLYQDPWTILRQPHLTGDCM
jgi:hypothetical protein